VIAHVAVTTYVKVEMPDDLLAMIVAREIEDPTYDELQTPDGVCEHLARNYAEGHMVYARQLEGFADLEDDSIALHIEGVDQEVER
jgi:hypothetical protein